MASSIRFDGYYIWREGGLVIGTGSHAFRFFPHGKVHRMSFPKFPPSPLHLLVKALDEKRPDCGKFEFDIEGLAMYFYLIDRPEDYFETMYVGRVNKDEIILNEDLTTTVKFDDLESLKEDLESDDHFEIMHEFDRMEESSDEPEESVYKFFPLPISYLQRFITKLIETKEMLSGQILEIFASTPDDAFWELIFMWVERYGLEPSWKQSYLKKKALIVDQKNSQYSSGSIATKLNLSPKNEKINFSDSQLRKFLKCLNKHLDAWQCASKSS